MKDQRYLLAIIFAHVLTSSPLAGADFEYVKIAVTGDPVAGGGTVGTILDFDLEGTAIAFRATGGPASPGIWRYDGGSILPVATSATPIPGGTGNFTDFASPSISNGEIAFRGVFGNPPRTGIYTTQSGSLTRVVDLTTPVPSGSGSFSNLYFGSFQSGGPGDTLARGVNSALSNGTTVFAGAAPSDQFGLYYAGTEGIAHRIVDTTTPVKAGSVASIDGDRIGFIGISGGTLGVYRFSIAQQTLTNLIPPGTTFPNGAQLSQDRAPAISGDAAAFTVETSFATYDGIYIADSAGVRLVANGSTPLPDAPGTFVTGSSGLGALGVSLSDGSVAFSSPRSSGGSAVYSTLGGSLGKVISTDDTLFGRTILSALSLGVPKISGGNILFSVSHSQTSSGLYVALSEHHWDAAGGAAWETPANWSFDLAPRGNIPTFLDPKNGGVIAGPAATTTLASLTIGASESGIAELQTQAAGQINVIESVTISERGRLQLGGTVTAGGVIDNRGVIAGAGQLSGQLINQETGSVRVGSGDRMTVAGSASSNAGAIDVTGGELEFTGGLTNLPSTGAITARDATLRFGALANAGSVAIVAGTTDIHGDITNTGTVAVSGGTAGGTQTAIFHDDFLNNGALAVSAAGATHSVAVFLGSFSGAGGITGGGDVFFADDLRPGNSPASVTYSANVTLTGNSAITMELAGRVEGTEYDHLTVTGDFTLGGGLEVVLINGFAAQAGDAFDLFDFDPALLSGDFASITLPPLAPGLRWDTSQLRTAGEIAVIPEPSCTVWFGLITALASFRRPRRRMRAT
jgi:hypothetical protein